jgi:glyoxylase-like metal-dependent hydrolase (beta-lactamase superfamily II)
MSLIKEVADKIYEIKPEGNELDRFPLCTAYLVVDDKTALIEAGCPVQASEFLEAMEELGYDAKELSYIIPTHVHGDHAGGAGLLAQWLPKAQVVAQPRVASLLADPSMTARLMQAFKHIFGDDAEERFGRMPAIPQEKFVLVEDGESIPLGGRELKVIHTPGHDPYHLSFLDTKSQGVFSGDALGAYFSEIEVIFTCPVPGSDLILFLQSIEKLQELKPELVFFSHGKATRHADKIIQSGLYEARLCQDVAFEALKAGKDQKEVARRLVEVMARGSASARSHLSDWHCIIPLTVEGYRQYFKKNKMI